MPKGHLTERYVQKAAVEWLEERYNNNVDFQAVVAFQEVVVHKNSNLGNGRADGLIASLACS
jgi:hypothetical protein